MDKDLQTLIFIFTFFGLLAFYIWFIAPTYSSSCLNKYADKYCSSINATNNGDIMASMTFRCYYQSDKRMKDYNITNSFNYLDSEKESCRIKSALSFIK